MEYIQELRKIFNEVPNDDKEIIANFFITFSIFEFGIKEFGLTDKNKKYPSPDWYAYVNRIIDKFGPNESQELKNAITYLKKNPPGKQRFNKSGSMIFDDRYFRNKKDINLHVLIEMIKTIRNNFFHGGKIKDFMKSDYERNISLFKKSLVILDNCLKIDDCIQEFL